MKESEGIYIPYSVIEQLLQEQRSSEEINNTGLEIKVKVTPKEKAFMSHLKSIGKIRYFNEFCHDAVSEQLKTIYGFDDGKSDIVAAKSKR